MRIDGREPDELRPVKITPEYVSYPDEYALLPRSTPRRTPHEIFKLGGRTQEIQRLIGRSLCAAVDLEKLGCIMDCHVLQADSRTRTAAIICGFAALSLALNQLYLELLNPAYRDIGQLLGIQKEILSSLPD